MPRSTMIKIGAGCVVVLFLLSRCGSDEEPVEVAVEAPAAQLEKGAVPTFDEAVIKNQIEQAKRAIETEMPTIGSEPAFKANPYDLKREDFLDVWEPTTTPYDAQCGEGCQEFASVEGDSHGYSSGRLLYNPAVDDPVAQWSDCVMSITMCFAETAEDTMSSREKDDVLITCVADSQCPARCREAFRSKTRTIMPGTVDTELENVFVGEQALCLPQEAWVQ